MRSTILKRRQSYIFKIFLIQQITQLQETLTVGILKLLTNRCEVYSLHVRCASEAEDLYTVQTVRAYKSGLTGDKAENQRKVSHRTRHSIYRCSSAPYKWFEFRLAALFIVQDINSQDRSYNAPSLHIQYITEMFKPNKQLLVYNRKVPSQIN